MKQIFDSKKASMGLIGVALNILIVGMLLLLVDDIDVWGAIGAACAMTSLLGASIVSQGVADIGKGKMEAGEGYRRSRV